ncbi:MAG TPA: ATP-binding protein [Anaerolineales bacterium]|nr:ATP-binding protein [Anaerolineales bacterium]
MTFFQRILSPPKFADDPEKTRHAKLIHLVSLILFLIFALLIVVTYVVETPFGQAFKMLFTGLVILQVATQILIRQGLVRVGGFILLTLSWLSITWIASVYDGVRSVILFTYFTIILSAGYLFGWRIVTLFTSWTILAVWLLAFYEVWGLSEPLMDSPVSIAINLTALFIFASIQIYFIINALKKSLSEADQELKERLRIEEKLIDERERLSLALDAAKMGTWNWDIETGIVSWSKGIEAMFGMDEGQFDGKYETYLSLIHPDDLPVLQSAINSALSDENYDYVVEHRLVWQNGEIRWQEGRGKVYRNADGKPIRMAGTTVDISERKEAEAEREQLIQELAEKNTELEQFTYTVSHDLKAPIITIKGFLGFLSEDVRSGNQNRIDSDISRITEATEKMHRLLNELLELSRIGRMMNPPEPVSLNDLIPDAVELLQGRLQTNSVKLKIAENLPVVHGDRQRLLEVIQNLIDNAVKFSSEKNDPVVEVGVEGYEGNMPIIFVRDNGIGIPSEHHERIFGLFNKLDTSAEGTGVGLALVKRIIEFHGGRIWVQSASSPHGGAGTGTTFYFTLPASKSKTG